MEKERGKIVFLLAWLDCAVLISGHHVHRAAFTYTAGAGSISDAVVFIDEVQIAHFDGHNKALRSSCPWMRVAMKESWENYEGFCKGMYDMLMDLQAHLGKMEGVQVFQLTSYCAYDEQTGVCGGYMNYGYNGEDFMSLDVNQMRYINQTEEAARITDVWNRQGARIDFVKNYFKEIPAYLKRAAPYLRMSAVPDVHVFQKNSSSPLTCLATGFNSSSVKMTWQKNRQDLHEDVSDGEILPNGDGTFQKMISLRVKTEEKDTYRCVVQHESWNETIVRNVPEDLISQPGMGRTHVPVMIPVILVLVFICALFFMCRRQRGQRQGESPDPENGKSLLRKPEIKG